MSLPYRVTVLGFSDFERSALASYFRLAANRSPSYEKTESAAEAHFLIVDADHADAVRTVVALGRVGESVFVGAQAPAGASGWTMRPVDPLHVLRELDAKVAALVSQRATAAPMNGPETSSSHVRTVIQYQRPKPVPARRADDPSPPPAQPGSGFVAVADAAPPPPALAAGGEALLVDDSEIALRYLESKLQRYGIATACATTSAKAIELMARRGFDFVFVDVELGAASELDGLALCQHIKRQHHYPAGRRAPVVMMVSAHASEIDRVRGTLAGADAYLGKPLDDDVLRRLLVQHGLTPPALPEEAQYL